MDDITEIRGKIERDVFDYQVLCDALSRFEKPRDKISRLLANRSIIRIKKGLYCFSEALRRRPISRQYVANLIYGPSYVSLDYALSYHGLIPERVNEITSVTTCRTRRFDTPLGLFTYRTLNMPRYSLGAGIESVEGETFLIACPEKALVDKVWTDKRFNGNRVGGYEDYLLKDLRIDSRALAALDVNRLQQIARAYDSAKVHNLMRYLHHLKGRSNA